MLFGATVSGLAGTLTWREERRTLTQFRPSFPSITLNKMFQVDSLNRKTNLNFDRFTRVDYTSQITNILLKANVNQTAVGKAATNP